MDEAGPADQRAPTELVLERLLTALLSRTAEGAAAWEVDDAHPDSFCLVGEGWVVATRSVDGDGTYPYVLTLAGPTGEPELEVRSTSAFGRPFADDFARLHAAAAATASMSGASELLDRIVSGLDHPASEDAQVSP